MNAAQKPNKRKDAINPGMQKPLVYSVSLHVIVLVLATLGLPFFMTKTEPVEMAMTVEIAELADISQTNVVDKPNESEKPEPIPPKPEEPKPVYKQTEAEEPTPPDDLLTPRAPDVEEVPEPPEEKPPEEKPKEELAKIEKPPKPMNKPKPPKPPKPKEEKPKEKPPEEEKPKEPEKDFTSLLKSLTPDQDEAPKPVQAPPQETAETGQTSQIARAGTELSRSELENLNSGVQPCWNVNAGGKDAGQLVVSLQVTVGPDMRVIDVKILDQVRNSSDSHFQAAAEAARRALLNETCRTLRLPPEKYEQWKVFKYNFDPSMLL